MKFDNDLTISVQIGTMNHCSRRSFDLDAESEMKIHIVESQDAEIAIWNETDQWFNFGTDQVKGWCSPDEVAEWISRVQKATNITNI